MRYSTLGIEFALAILFGLGIGLWLDDWFETRVVCTLIGVFYGFATGFYLVYRGVYAPPGEKGARGEAEGKDDEKNRGSSDENSAER